LIVSNQGYIKYVFSESNKKNGTNVDSDTLLESDSLLILYKLRFIPNSTIQNSKYIRTSVIVNFTGKKEPGFEIPESYKIISSKEDLFKKDMSLSTIPGLKEFPYVDIKELKPVNSNILNNCYPEESRKSKVEDEIPYFLDIDEDGFVERVLSMGLNNPKHDKILRISGRDCLYNLKFEPYIKDNIPSFVKTRLLLKFKINE
jgi:hypothetical protein